MMFGKLEDAEKEVVSKGRFLTFYKSHFKDAVTGEPRVYECFERANNKDRMVNGVDIIGLIKRKEQPVDEADVILIEQYRPPVNSMCLEFPAGLVEPGEDPAAAAARELTEETGYVPSGAPTLGTPITYADPSITSDSTVVYMFEIDPDAPENSPENRKQHLDSDEHISVKTVKFAKLLEVCNEYAAKGYSVDCKVYMTALGYAMKNAFK